MIIVVGSCSVVYIIILHLKLQVLVQLEVRTDAVDASHRVPFGILPIDIVAAINLQPRGNRHAKHGVPGIGPVGSVIELAARMVRIFGTEAPVLMLIDTRECPSVAPYAHAVCAGVSARPTIDADEEVFNRLHLDVAHPVLLFVVVLLILPIAVIYGGLITDEAMLVVAYREEVALELQAEVAAVLSCLAAAIVRDECRHPLCQLRIVA